MKDFAVFIQKLVDEEYPDAEVIRIIADNLNTHKIKSFYQAGSQLENVVVAYKPRPKISAI